MAMQAGYAGPHGFGSAISFLLTALFYAGLGRELAKTR